MYAASLAFSLTPSELVVVDMCCSHVKDLSILETCGVVVNNYVGFDNDTDAPSKAKEFHKTDMQLVYHLDAVHCSDAEMIEAVRSALRERGIVSKPHIILYNFAIHLFNADFGKIFRTSAEWADTHCFMQCAYISCEGFMTVLNNHASYGMMVEYDVSSSTLSFSGMAQYTVVGDNKIIPMILKKNNDRGFQNNGVEEYLASDSEIVRAADAHAFYPLTNETDMQHVTLYKKSIEKHINHALLKDAEKICLEAFLTLHKTLLFKRM